jgi:hypothetical protein
VFDWTTQVPLVLPRATNELLERQILHITDQDITAAMHSNRMRDEVTTLDKRIFATFCTGFR